MKSLAAIGITLALVILPTTMSRSEGKKHERYHKIWEMLMSLSPADREKYQAARKRAMSNPEVAAADERRKKVDAEYRKILHREMLKEDPSLAPVLDKISELRKKDDL